LDSLATAEIRHFLLSKGIDPVRFGDAASTKMVSDLLPNPFYLTRLAKIYSEENCLPPKTELMEKLVSVNFSADEQKFPGNLEDHYRALFWILEKIAFAMQLMHH